MPPDGDRIEFHYAAQGPVLAAYIADRSRRSIIRGPLGSGKTNGTCYKVFRIMVEQAPASDGVRYTRIAFVRNTYSDLLSTTAKDWLSMFGGLGDFRQSTREPPTQFVQFRLPDGTRIVSEVLFIALDRLEHVRKIRGLQLTAAILSEAKELNKAVVDMLDLRVGRFPSGAQGEPTWHGLLGDTNSPDEDEWLYRLAEEERPEGWAFFHQPGGVIRDPGGPWRANPDAENLANLVEGYYVDGMSGKGDDWIAVNLGNEYGYVRDGKVVYPEFMDNVHVREFELDPRMPLALGMDFGLTPAGVIGQRTVTGRWLIRYELVSTRMGATAFGEELARFIRGKLDGWEFESMTGDPAGDSGDADDRTVFSLLESAGIKAKPAHTNDFSVRRDAVAVPLGRLIDGHPGLVVHPDCKVLRKGMAGRYCFKRVKVAGDERFHDKPDKNAWSHVCEALQYLMLGAGEGKVLMRPRVPPSAHMPMVADLNYPTYTV